MVTPRLTGRPPPADILTMKRWRLAVMLWLTTGWPSLLPVLTALAGVLSLLFGRGNLE